MSGKEKMVVHLRVEEQHIRNGERESPRNCPIALALKDVTDLKPYVDIESMALRERWTGIDLWCLVGPPPEAVEFIRHFDNGDDVEPFAVDLTFERCEDEDDDIDIDDWENDEEDEEWP